jgi:hypothetical protein
LLQVFKAQGAFLQIGLEKRVKWPENGQVGTKQGTNLC